MPRRIRREPAMDLPTELTADEFIAWALEQPTGRFELSNGRVVSMASERVSHAIAKFNTAVALRGAIAARGAACRAFTDGMAVRIDARTLYEPDAAVRCGPELPGDAVELTDPVIIVEVASPSSRGLDSSTKLTGYFALPSLRHYLVINAGDHALVHHRRDEKGQLLATIVRDGQLALDPPGLTLEVRDIFDGV